MAWFLRPGFLGTLPLVARTLLARPLLALLLRVLLAWLLGLLAVGRSLLLRAQPWLLCRGRGVFVPNAAPPAAPVPAAPPRLVIGGWRGLTVNRCLVRGLVRGLDFGLLAQRRLAIPHRRPTTPTAPPATPAQAIRLGFRPAFRRRFLPWAMHNLRCFHLWHGLRWRCGFGLRSRSSTSNRPGIGDRFGCDFKLRARNSGRRGVDFGDRRWSGFRLWACDPRPDRFGLGDRCGRLGCWCLLDLLGSSDRSFGDHSDRNRRRWRWRSSGPGRTAHDLFLDRSRGFHRHGLCARFAGGLALGGVFFHLVVLHRIFAQGQDIAQFRSRQIREPILARADNRGREVLF